MVCVRFGTWTAVLSLSAVLSGCGDSPTPGADAGAGDLLIGQDCPDSCIPRCVFEALSQISTCMPAGNSQLYANLRCYENGIVELCAGPGTQRYFYKDGVAALRWTADFTWQWDTCSGAPPRPGNTPTYLEVKGPGDVLLVQGSADEAAPSHWTFICEGTTRMVDLTVNATNPACSRCPADFVHLPIPPLPLPTFGDASCHVP